MAQQFFSRSSVLLMLICMGLSACAGPPVQEMSNARQAIRAAREAGAATTAPQTLVEAESLLEKAQSKLEQRAYKEARRDAIAARGKAAEALDAVQQSYRRGST